jgi:hypothetical protein
MSIVMGMLHMQAAEEMISPADPGAETCIRQAAW